MHSLNKSLLLPTSSYNHLQIPDQTVFPFFAAPFFQASIKSLDFVKLILAFSRFLNLQMWRQEINKNCWGNWSGPCKITLQSELISLWFLSVCRRTNIPGWWPWWTPLAPSSVAAPWWPPGTWSRPPTACSTTRTPNSLSLNLR